MSEYSNTTLVYLHVTAIPMMYNGKNISVFVYLIKYNESFRSILLIHHTIDIYYIHEGKTQKIFMTSTNDIQLFR